MDLTQRKLTREEWNSVEISVSKDEKDILQMIMKGYHDNSIIENKTPSLLSYLKIAHTPVMEQHIYQVYCKDIIEKQKKKASQLLKLKVTIYPLQLKKMLLAFLH